MDQTAEILPDQEPHPPGLERSVIHEDGRVVLRRLTKYVDDTGATRYKRVIEKLTDCEVRVICAIELDGVFALSVGLRPPNRREYCGVLQAKVLESATLINEWAFSVGRCCWNIEKHNRWDFKRWLCAQDGCARIVYHLLTTGYQPHFGIWAAEGLFLDGAANAVQPDQDGNYTCRCGDREMRQFKLAAPHLMHTPRIIINDEERDLFVTMSVVKARAILRAWFERLFAFFSHHGATLAFGWTIAHLYRDHLWSLRRGFPHLYLYGAKETGKTVIGRKIYDALSMHHVTQISFKLAVKNPKSVRNQLQDTCNLPLWIDEIRNEVGADEMAAIIRSSYDGSSGSLTQRNGYGAKQFEVRRAMLLSGQHLVGSEAEMRRCVLIRCGLGLKPDAWSDLTAFAPQVERAMLTFMAQRGSLHRVVARHAEQYSDALKRTGVDGSLAWGWALSLAGVRLAGWLDDGAASPFEQLPAGLLSEAVSRAKNALLTAKREGVLGLFWSIVESLDAAGKLTNRERSSWVRLHRVCGGRQPRWNKDKPILPDGDYLLVWLEHLFQAASDSPGGRRLQGFTLDGILTECHEVAGYITGPVRTTLNPAKEAMARPCWVFSMDAAIPDFVKDLARFAAETHGELLP